MSDELGDKLHRALRDSAVTRAWRTDPQALDKIRDRTSAPAGGCLLALALLPLWIVLAPLAAAGKKPRRRCRTVDEAFAAGWEDGAGDPPMTEAQVAKLAALWRLQLRDRQRQPAA